MISKQQYKALLAFLPKGGPLAVDGEWVVAISENAHAVAWAHNPHPNPHPGPARWVMPLPLGQVGKEVHPERFEPHPGIPDRPTAKPNHWRKIGEWFRDDYEKRLPISPNAYDPKLIAMVAKAYDELGRTSQPLEGPENLESPGFFAIGDALFGAVMPVNRRGFRHRYPLHWPD